jgi:membrane fusion protein, multidrug efflux system
MKLQRKYWGFAAGAIVFAFVGWRLAQDHSDNDGSQTGKAVPITAGQVTMHDVPLYARGVGTVQAYNTVTVQARVDGQLDSVDFQEGQDVKAGAPLAHIDPRPFQAALDNALAAQAKDQATLDNARMDLKRYQDTAPKGYSTKQQLDAQQATVNSLVAAVQGDAANVENARVQLGYTDIVSPIDGRTGIRHIDKGNIVHATDAGGLVVITQLQPISAIFTLPQDLLPQVTAGQAAGTLEVVAFTRDDTTELDHGTLELVDNQIDPATGTIKLKAKFANPKLALWPGQFVNIRLQTGNVHNGLTVDSRVAQRGPQGVFAYVIKPDDTVEMRSIEAGQDYRGQLLVTKGLTAGERVVVDGQLRLEPGTKVSTDADKPQQTGSLDAPVAPAAQ